MMMMMTTAIKKMEVNHAVITKTVIVISCTLNFQFSFCHTSLLIAFGFDVFEISLPPKNGLGKCKDYSPLGTGSPSFILLAKY